MLDKEMDYYGDGMKCSKASRAKDPISGEALGRLEKMVETAVSYLGRL